MKKIFTSIFILLCILSKGQLSYYIHNFEGPASQNQLTLAIGTNTDNIWQVGVPQKTLFASASTTPNAIITLTAGTYPINNTSSFSLAVPINYTYCSWCPFALQWNQKLDMEQGKDGGIVEFSTNNQTWYSAFTSTSTYQFYGFMPANVATISTTEKAFTGTDNVWRSIWLCISPQAVNTNDTIWFRFIFKSDGVETDQEGWVLDNFYAHQTFVHPVKEQSMNKSLVVYPNITNGVVNVEAKKIKPDDRIDNISLLDVNGNMIEDYGPNFSKVVLDISKHPPGTYYLKIRIGKKVESYKVIYVKE